jgi:hypothetical protein
MIGPIGEMSIGIPLTLKRHLKYAGLPPKKLEAVIYNLL